MKKIETELKEQRGLEAELKEQKARTDALQEEMARLKASHQAEINKAYIEGGEDAAPLYEAQVESLLATVVESGWRMALKEAGISDKHPIYMNLPKYTASEIAQSPATVVTSPIPSSVPSVEELLQEVDAPNPVAISCDPVIIEASETHPHETVEQMRTTLNSAGSKDLKA